MCNKNDSLGFGLGVLVGVVGGIFAGVLLAPQKGEDSRREVKEAICNLVETQSPNVKEAKKQALESIDLMKYKIEKQFKRLNNSLKSRKLEKAKELEEIDTDYEI